MDSQLKQSLKSFLIEFLVYAAAVVLYFFLVLRYLGNWLAGLFHQDRPAYAAVALVLIVCQGVVLELLTRALLDFIRPRLEN